MQVFIDELEERKKVLSWVIQGLGITGLTIKDSRYLTTARINNLYNTTFEPSKIFVKEVYDPNSCQHWGNVIDIHSINCLPSVTGDPTRYYDGFCCGCDTMVYGKIGYTRIPWTVVRNIGHSDTILDNIVSWEEYINQKTKIKMAKKTITERKDCLGNTIKIGDRVAYSTGYISSIGIGRIQSFTPKRAKIVPDSKSSWVPQTPLTGILKLETIDKELPRRFANLASSLVASYTSSELLDIFNKEEEERNGAV